MNKIYDIHNTDTLGIYTATIHGASCTIVVSEGNSPENVLREALTSTNVWREERLAKYPPMGDQIDAIVKGFIYLRSSGIEFPAATNEWLDKIQSIKEEHPKNI